jgi:drug/metabolite transporter (DMT)-like permease
VPLAPLWVWLVFGEEPTFSALIGGAIALAAVIWCLWGLREAKLEREVGSLTTRLKDAP